MNTLLLTDEELVALRTVLKEQSIVAETELFEAGIEESPSSIAYWTTHLATIRLIQTKVETLNDTRRATHA